VRKPKYGLGHAPLDEGHQIGEVRLVQETARKQSIFTINAFNVPLEDIAKNGAEKVRVRYLIDERHGSGRFALRLYAVEKGGHTPLDEHAYEHHVYVLSGRGLLRESKETGPMNPLQAGDTVFIPSQAVHQFSNEWDEPFVFLCVKGNPALYLSNEQPTPSVPGRNYC
jgi:quercetin dioxygenase-like cupin family protein